MKVVKRDGREVEYDKSKIVIAISKANEAGAPDAVELNERDINYVAENVEADLFSGYTYPTIEDIQNLVVAHLGRIGAHQTVIRYSKYREDRNTRRKENTTDGKVMSLINNQNRELAEENANKSTVIAATQRDYIAGIVSRDITQRKLMPEYISKAHDEGVIHFHDADYFIQPIFNCCLLNIGDMLDNGTVMNDKLIESPKSFQVACTVVTQIIACVASNQYGGQSVDLRHLGKYLRRSREKYNRKIREACPELPDDEATKIAEIWTKEELKAGVQTIQYQINTLMTTNGQSPFVTLFLNLQMDDPYIEENALIIEEVLKQRLEGIKNEEGIYITPAFPKLVYVLDEHNCLKGGKYDYITKLAVRCSAKRMYPDYISAKKMRENYQGNVFSPMGCRSFLAPWKNEKGEYQFEGRFNQGVVSLNLPQIGIIADGDEEKFWQLMDERLQICYDALMLRHNALKHVISDNSPIHWQYGVIARLKKGEHIDKYLYGGYSSISLGYIGLYEVTKLMTGVSHTDPKGFEFAMRVMKRLRKACDDWKAQTNIGFALYGTPAESLCYRFAKIDAAKFGQIPDITDKGYYTNSYHVDVREDITAFDKLKFENQFQPISSGGCISYVEVPNMQHNLEAMEEMVRFIYDNIQYAEFNTKSDYCKVCGFDGEMLINDEDEWECPCCHNTDRRLMNVVRRTCGYLGEKYWNKGKTKEIKSRVLHVSE
ncbi:MAG: anaerobic ribonucleoside-triphosphate reductase [Muribaculaceae bacterium]|nr:anaerobic ribonucleoside-triphosphate reductase [Muribaculaceae bacterium]